MSKCRFVGPSNVRSSHLMSTTGKGYWETLCQGWKGSGPARLSYSEARFPHLLAHTWAIEMTLSGKGFGIQDSKFK